MSETERKAIAPAPQRKEAHRAARKGEAITDLMLEIAQFFFRLRALGQKTGLITNWGAGAFGFMRSLALIGPLTVPQIAEMRPTSRQRLWSPRSAVARPQWPCGYLARSNRRPSSLQRRVIGRSSRDSAHCLCA